MDEQAIPIDINNNKLLEWLVSRRHVPKDWQNNILKVREKINAAIQDMPAHEGIIRLLTGQHINYFHCLKIIEILKETEADSKNLFGRYGSQRMRDWLNIVSSYEKDNIYLAEAAQILIRNVSYEIPSLKKQIAKLEVMKCEAEKKIKDYKKNEQAALKDFSAECEQLGIKGENIKVELLNLLNDLPRIYKDISEKMNILQPAIQLYQDFHDYISNKNEAVVTLLNFIIKKGNTTTYEYIYGEKPLSIEPQRGATPPTNILEDIDDVQIDFGAIEYLPVPVETGGEIDWGATEDEDFEIVQSSDIDLEESGIVVEKSGMDGGVARGGEALTLLDNPKMRDLLINELHEVEAFLRMRLFELANGTGDMLLTVSQDAPVALQMQTMDTVTQMSDCVNVILNELTNKKISHLVNIKHSPKYVDLLTGSLGQKLTLAERLRGCVRVLEEQIKGYRQQTKNIEPSVKLLIEKTKELQKEIQEDISNRYKRRPVNIVGGINML